MTRIRLAWPAGTVRASEAVSSSLRSSTTMISKSGYVDAAIEATQFSMFTASLRAGMVTLTRMARSRSNARAGGSSLGTRVKITRKSRTAIQGSANRKMIMKRAGGSWAEARAKDGTGKVHLATGRAPGLSSPSE
ncbi:MAG TPA: hypothetical protein EYQ27_06350 [Gemmatimonadetes bacterium]|nr:hypothetical protein [Gemmatimonadota bacterium]